jgi:hypothetical protein
MRFASIMRTERRQPFDIRIAAARNGLTNIGDFTSFNTLAPPCEATISVSQLLRSLPAHRRDVPIP